jgi:hypothetical protein
MHFHFFDCISLTKTIMPPDDIAVRVLTTQPPQSTRRTRRKLFKRELANGWRQVTTEKVVPGAPKIARPCQSVQIAL